jgi:dinuclear metal center YbgI/SA1388 family protein
MSLTLEQLTAIVDTFAPFAYASSWDNVGLQIGEPDAPVRRVLLTLDITPAVIQEARRKRCDAIISHHPLIFHPMKRILPSAYPGSLVMKLIRNGVGVVVAHTNLDKSPHGTNKALADALGLLHLELFQPEFQAPHVKFTVFVPKGYENKIIHAIDRGGGGIIGLYSHCTFRTPGIGTYVPLAGAKPFKGRSGKLEMAEEYRLEAVVPKSHIHSVIAEVVRVHPYEEVAYDVYTLEPGQTSCGLGYVGRLKRPMQLKAFAKKVKSALKAEALAIVGSQRARIATALVCGGSASELISVAGKRSARSATAHRADVIVTGELSHHAALEAQALGLCVIAAGHFATEWPVVPHLAQLLRNNSQIKHARVAITISAANAPPMACG